MVRDMVNRPTGKRGMTRNFKWRKPADGSLSMPPVPRAVAAVSPALDPSIGIVVCIPSFRRPQHLRLTLESLAGQRTDRRFAVVIVENDAAGCGSVPVAAEFLRGRQISRIVRDRAAARQLPRDQCRVRDRGWRRFPQPRSTS